MKINTALILCAGYGKRLNPLTLKTPKPLLKIKNISLLENCINLIINLGIKKILINSYHLKKQINDFVKDHNYDAKIYVIEDGEIILGTGGGILNLIKNSDDSDFLILNPDTIWNIDYKNEINQMIDFYFKYKLRNILLLVNKVLSFDKNLPGDFGLKNNIINHNHQDYIYTGCQLVNRSILDNGYEGNFPMTRIWFDLIKTNRLSGFESKLKFHHITNLSIFNKLKDL